MCIPTQTFSMHVAIYGSLCKSPGQYDGQPQLKWSYEECVFLECVSLPWAYCSRTEYGRGVDDLVPELMFILVINQLYAQNLFYNKFISCLYMFRAPCAHRQEVKIVLYSLWYHHTCRWPSRARVHRTATYRYDDTRGCIIQF